MLSSRQNLGRNPCFGHNADGIQEYLVGELSQRHVAAFEKVLREDARLAARVQSMQRQNALLRELRSDILDEPVPEQLMAALNGSRRAQSRQGFFGPRARPAGNRRPTRLRAAASALFTLVIGLASANRRASKD